MEPAVKQGFTLIELLVVISIIALMMAIGLPAYSAWQRSSLIGATRSTVLAISGAIASYPGGHAILVPATVSMPERSRRLWDFNDDRFLDGDPAIDDRFAATDRSDAAAAGYHGFAARAGLSLERQRLDGMRRVLDAWRRPLRIAHAATIYGPTGVGIWSDGPDGIEGSDDDITSWSE
jgi:prepilin-type N-terminal cleavage/methylation domain-containing protein